MITKKDQDLYNFLEDFHIADSKHLKQIFFENKSNQYACGRLKYLSDQGFIKRTKSTISNGYAYFTSKKPEQIHHDLLRVKIFTTLRRLYTISEWGNEVTIGNIRPDAVAFINNNNIAFPVLAEVHLSNRFNFDKYIEFVKSNDIKSMFGVAPRVLIFTDRKVTIPNIGIKFKVIKLDMSGLDTLFK